MSKKDTIKPGHFKLAGRERPGKDTVPELEKQKLKTTKAEEEFPGPNPGEQTSLKAGSKSSAKKEENSRYGSDPYPSTRPVPGAFGDEDSNPEPVHGDRAAELNRAREDLQPEESRQPKIREAGGKKMPENLEELMMEQLRDLYDAEKQALKALPRMAKAATSPDVRKAFNDHSEQTKGQVQRIEEIFSKLGEKPQSKPCKGMEGLIAEADEHISEEMDGEFKDAMLIGAEMKAEHYEMAAYQSAQELADMLGNKDAARRLRQNLTEEERMSRKLSQLSSRWLKKAVRAEHQRAA